MLYIHVHIQAGRTEERVNPFLYNTNNKQVEKLEFTRFYLCQDSPIPYMISGKRNKAPNPQFKKKQKLCSTVVLKKGINVSSNVQSCLRIM